MKPKSPVTPVLQLSIQPGKGSLWAAATKFRQKLQLPSSWYKPRKQKYVPVEGRTMETGSFDVNLQAAPLDLW